MNSKNEIKPITPEQLAATQAAAREALSQLRRMAEAFFRACGLAESQLRKMFEEAARANNKRRKAAATSRRSKSRAR